MDLSDAIVFWGVVAARFLVPLLIPRFPLPSIVAALVLDAVDQTVFQTFTGLELAGYQSYDKALDVYYLSIAYVSTMRNWRNGFAIEVARFLFYYRIAGVLLFELVEQRWLLLVFANTFEYFFIAVEVIRLRWDPVRLSRRAVLGIAGAIWVGVKLPQEYWIHVAQLDVTDEVKTRLLGADVDAGWGEAVAGSPLVAVVLVALCVAAVVAVPTLLVPRLPAADPAERRGLAADPLPAPVATAALRARLRAERWSVRSVETFEQVVLVSLLCSIFAQMLPGVETGPLRMTVGVTVLVVLDSAVALWAARGGHSPESVWAAFAALLALDLGVLLLGAALFDVTVDRPALVVFVTLLTLLVALYTRDRPVLDHRRRTGELADGRAAASPVG